VIRYLDSTVFENSQGVNGSSIGTPLGLAVPVGCTDRRPTYGRTLTRN